MTAEQKLWQIEWLSGQGQPSPQDFRLETPTGPGDISNGRTRVSGWYLPGGPGAALRVFGADDALLAEQHTHILRNDVMVAQNRPWSDWPGLQNCGFDLFIDSNAFPLRLEWSGKDISKTTLKLSRADDSDARPPGPPFALPGRGGHLFLGGDSNDSIGQFTGAVQIPAQSLAAWKRNFDMIPRWETEYGLRSAFMVALAKEEVLPDLHPYPRAKNSCYQGFTNTFPDQPGVVPLRWALHNNRDYAYRKTDTHWSDFGATMAAREVLLHWDMPHRVIGALPQEFSVRQMIGDLGNKMSPPQASRDLVFSEDFAPRRVFDLGVENSGRIWIYNRPDAPIDSCCVIFGDSFGENLAPALSRVFSKLVYIYRPAAIDRDIIEIFRPRHVVLEITQRFLTGQPDLGRPLLQVSAEKIARMPPARRAAVMENLERTDLPEIARIRERLEPCLNDLNVHPRTS